MTTLAETNFTTGAVLTWAIPLTLVLVVLVWWARCTDRSGAEVERGRRLMVRRVALVVGLAAVAGVVAGVVAHVATAPSAARSAALPLPELHGQATWPAGTRRAPRSRFATCSAAASRSPPRVDTRRLIAFLDSRCRSLCPLVGRALGEIQRALPAGSRARASRRQRRPGRRLGGQRAERGAPLADGRGVALAHGHAAAARRRLALVRDRGAPEVERHRPRLGGVPDRPARLRARRLPRAAAAELPRARRAPGLD